MLDYRHETFLALCGILSYTKTAEALHITQPAVSQHIKYLETLYKGKLFLFQNKKLCLTPKGEELYGFLATIQADSAKMADSLRQQEGTTHPVAFGATLTIGEYCMPSVLEHLLAAFPAHRFSMTVDNTKALLEKLHRGEIQFALLEGYFQKSEYSSWQISRESFVAVCSPSSPLAHKRLCWEELFPQRLILREDGSGTREVLTHTLKAHNLSIESFAQTCEISNLNVIKQLVAQNMGISFMYKAAAEKELAEKTLCQLEIEGFAAHHEFTFVFLKGSRHEAEYQGWFNAIQQNTPGQR